MITHDGDAPDPTTAYHWRADDAVAAFASDAVRGLTDDEARARLERYGPNELTAHTPVPRWRRLIAQFKDVLVILLLVATAISAGLWVFERDTALPYEAIAIVVVVMLNAAMGYVQGREPRLRSPRCAHCPRRTPRSSATGKEKRCPRRRSFPATSF